MRALTLGELILLNLLRERERMAIEIKGLAANVTAAQAAIRRARVATARMNESGATLERTATEIAEAFDKHTEDLLFEAQTLGNAPDDLVRSSDGMPPAPLHKAPE
jgi:hypothetical protein